MVLRNRIELLTAGYESAVLPLELTEHGTGGRTRTDTELNPRDFKSRAAYHYATPAQTV